MDLIQNNTIFLWKKKKRLWWEEIINKYYYLISSEFDYHLICGFNVSSNFCIYTFLKYLNKSLLKVYILDFIAATQQCSFFFFWLLGIILLKIILFKHLRFHKGYNFLTPVIPYLGIQQCSKNKNSIKIILNY